MLQLESWSPIELTNPRASNAPKAIVTMLDTHSLAYSLALKSNDPHDQQCNESSRLASRMDWIVESEISVARALSLSLSLIRETLNSIQSTIHPSLLFSSTPIGLMLWIENRTVDRSRWIDGSTAGWLAGWLAWSGSREVRNEHDANNQGTNAKEATHARNYKATDSNYPSTDYGAHIVSCERHSRRVTTV